MTEFIQKNPVAAVLVAALVGLVAWIVIGWIWPLVKLVLLLVGLFAITSWLYKALR